jgi:ABC-type transport system involved in multi-copper enzyme maturation permease subunit
MRTIRLVARRELWDSLQSRWLIGFGLLLAFLTSAISYYGLNTARQTGFQGFGLVAASLMNLVLFTVPLVAMAQTCLSLAQRADDLPILLTQAVRRRQILLGKYVGVTGALVVTLLGGLALGGGLVLLGAGGEHAGDFLLLLGLTAVLIGVFAAIGATVATRWYDRTKALGIGLSLWFVLVILYDLIVFGIALGGSALPLRTLLLLALALNPVDAVRVLYLLVTQNQTFVGATGAVMAETFGGAGRLVLLVMLGAWLVGALWLAVRLFERKDF